MTRTRLAALAVSLGLVAAPAVPALAAAGKPASARSSATRSVRVGDNFFVARGKTRTLTIKKGTTLRFAWKTHGYHNVVGSGARDDPFSSGTPKRVRTFSHTFKKRGLVRIVCVLHGKMRLRVKIV